MSEDRAREVLAAELEAAGYIGSARALRAGDLSEFTSPALTAVLAYADEMVKAERERCCDGFYACLDQPYDRDTSSHSCEHGVPIIDDCIACYDDHLRAEITAIRKDPTI